MSKRSKFVAGSPQVATKDPWNQEAADTLAAMRRLAGLTLEQVAGLTGENFKTIWLREKGEVALGALREYTMLRAYIEKRLELPCVSEKNPTLPQNNIPPKKSCIHDVG